MKKLLFLLAAVAPVASATAQKTTKPAAKAPVKKTTTTTAPALKLKNLTDSASYALGVNIASSLKMQSMTGINTSIMTKAMNDVFKGQPTIIGENESFTVLNAYSNKMQEQKSKGAIEAGVAFLKQNKTRPGVKTTASGLQYEVITEGTGVKPAATDNVTCKYSGKLIDGTEFDASSRHSPEGISFQLDRVIAGWTEGLQLMSVGSKYRFFIPYELGYGLQGSPPTIPGGAALIFEVELVDVKKAGN